MSPTDVPAAAAIGRAVFSGPDEVPTPLDVERSERRYFHLQATDPGGAWVAVDDGTVCGAALGIVRERIWGLSLLAVLPDVQARGIGRRLLERAWAHGDGASGRIILSSTDPKAMRRYARAGLRLRPCVAAAGIVDRSRLPAPSPRVVVSEDVERTAAISRHVRGAGHHVDVPVMLQDGGTLLRHGDRGFAVHDGAGTVKLLAARDPEAATELLWACLAAAPPGATASVEFIAAEQDWAVQTVLEAGLALSPDGPLFVGGELGPMTPYLPSGPYL